MFVTFPTTCPVTHFKTLRVMALNDLTFDLPKPIHRRYIYIYIHIQGVSGGRVNILGGGRMDYSE